MSTEQKYNGWSNYATWRVNLEILDDYVASLVGEGPRWISVEHCMNDLGEAVDNALTNFGENEEGLTLDYARAFVSDVNYYEIAETILADNPELFTDAHHVGYPCDCPECAGEPEA